MKKFLLSLALGGILIGAVYATAASLTVSGTQDVGFGNEVVVAPTNVTNIEWGLDPSDIANVLTATLTMQDEGSTDDKFDFQILKTDCNGASTWLIQSATGTLTTSKVFFLDSGGTGTAGSDGFPIKVANIGCVQVTILVTGS